MAAQTTIKKLVRNTLAIAITAASISSYAQGSAVEFLTMKQDITALASDEMKGRANFSPEIDQAGNYIAKRFDNIGLSQLAGVKNFKQRFSIFQVAPKSLTITLNDQPIAPEHMTIASAQTQFSWQFKQTGKQTEQVNIHVISAKDDMRSVIGELNQQGGQHVVLINPAHKGLFDRYHKYFQSGLIKNELNNDHALVMILTDVEKATELSIAATAEVKQQQLTNIVGILPGTEKPNEIVLYSAHYDHLGANGEGQIYNGADDDASGTTAVINIAEYFAKRATTKNKRTLMFAAFTAEEIGGFGSKYFSQQLNPDNVVAMVNIEMIGKPSKFGAGKVWMTGMERSNLGQLMNQALEPSNGEIHKDPYPEQRLFYRSDNATLARLGVPAHSFSSTQIDKDQHYHQTSDDINSLDLKSMHTVINSLALATQGLVDGSITPTRVDTSKVKAKGKIY